LEFEEAMIKATQEAEKISVLLHSSSCTQQTHFKGIKLHLLARIIAWLPAPVEIE
jgi:hypothetical protein